MNRALAIFIIILGFFIIFMFNFGLLLFILLTMLGIVLINKGFESMGLEIEFFRKIQDFVIDMVRSIKIKPRNKL